MRRSDRQVTDSDKILDIIKGCYCCRIGFNDDGKVYIVPMNFGYDIRKDSYIFYFHGAKEGRKVDLIAKNPNVGFEMDANFELNEAETACGYSARYGSIIGNGVVSIVTEFKEKKHGLGVIMEHYTGKSNWEFEESRINGVNVFKLIVTEMSCKEHN